MGYTSSDEGTLTSFLQRIVLKLIIMIFMYMQEVVCGEIYDLL